jgi:hypothetical protein
MVYPDLWIALLIGMPTDTLVTSTQHLDATEAHFVALNNVQIKKIIKETHVQAHDVPIHVIFDFTDITNERVQVMSSLLIKLTTAQSADERLANVKERVDHLKACIDLSNELADDLIIQSNLRSTDETRSYGNCANIPLAPPKTNPKPELIT